jgi:peptide/nickel transport system substrate-binding protein
MKKLMLIILMVALAASMILVGCSKTTTTTPAPTTPANTTTAPVVTTVAPVTTTAAPKPTTPAAKAGGTIRLIFTEAPTGSLGIPENMKGFSVFYSAPMLEGLVRRNPDNSFSPLLAESWDWSKDSLTVTFHLRKGVKFHDGTDFNATVVKWNIDRQIAAKVGGTDNIVSQAIIDDYTYQMVIAKYQNTWFGNLAAMSTQISPDNVTKNGAAYADWNPVGTGPFKFKEYKENDSLTLVRNDSYWGVKPLLDGVKCLFIADATTQQIAFEAGEGDILESVKEAKAADLAKKNYYLDMSPGLGTMLIPSSGIAGSPYTKQEVREAVEYAINKDAVVKSIGMGYWRPLTELVGQGKTGYIAELPGRKYDPAKAKQLLAAGGYPNGFNTQITCASIFNNDAVTAMQADLKAVGINADLNIVSPQKWLDNMVNGIAEGIEVEPITTMEADFGVNLNRYWITPLKQQYGAGCWWTTLKRPDGMDQMIQDYLVVPDFAGQKVKAQAITKLAYDTQFVIPLWESTTIIVEQKYVKEMNYGQLGWPFFNYTGAWMDLPAK